MLWARFLPTSTCKIKNKLPSREFFIAFKSHLIYNHTRRRCSSVVLQKHLLENTFQGGESYIRLCTKMDRLFLSSFLSSTIFSFLKDGFLLTGVIYKKSVYFLKVFLYICTRRRCSSVVPKKTPNYKFHYFGGVFDIRRKPQ